MRVLLDSHILLAIALKRLPKVSAKIARRLERQEVRAWASVASLWEIAIKTRLGKRDPGMPLASLPQYFEAVGLTILPVTAAHAIAEPAPRTRDPFARLLLAQCAVGDFCLVTVDHAAAQTSARRPPRLTPLFRP